MSFEEQAATLTPTEVVALLIAHQQLTARVEELTHQVEWFKRQLFGSKSERRPGEPDGRQQFLGEWTQDRSAAVDTTVVVAEHQR